MVDKPINTEDAGSKPEAQAASTRDMATMQAILNEVGAYVYTKDTRFRYNFANRRFLAFLEQPLTAVLGARSDAFFDNDFSTTQVENDQRVLEERREIANEETIRLRDRDKVYTFWTVKKPLFDADGNIIGICGISTDITEKKEMERTLRDQRDLLGTILNNIDAHVFLKDNQRRFLYVNAPVAKLFGHPVEHIIGRRDVDILPVAIADYFWEMDQRVFKTGRRQEREEIFTDADGRTRHSWAIRLPWKADNGVPTLIGFSTDITATHELQEKLRHQARVDSLTATGNRRGFHERATEVFKRSRRQDMQLALIEFDIDFFKQVNDLYGHPVGDEVLKNVARCCRDTTREQDFTARIGGEEFAILLPDTDMDTARGIAERTRTLIQHRQVSTRYPDLRITASFGVAAMCRKDTDFDALFLRTDQALYDAKQGGRNRIVVVDDPA